MRQLTRQFGTAIVAGMETRRRKQQQAAPSRSPRSTLVARAVQSAPNGFWLAAHMDARGVGPEEIAGHLGVQRETIWKWQVGKAEPDKATRDRIAAFLEIAEMQLWHPPGFVDLNAAASHIKDERLRQKLAEWLKDYPTE